MCSQKATYILCPFSKFVFIFADSGDSDFIEKTAKSPVFGKPAQTDSMDSSNDEAETPPPKKKQKKGQQTTQKKKVDCAANWKPEEM